MANPELQTVLTLTSGNSDQTKRSFRWGTAVPPIPIGTRGEWYVHAPGVLAVHLYVAFDGRMVHVAAAPGARVTVRGVEVGQEWSPVPVRTEVRFGDASFALTCEEVSVEAGGARPADAQGGTGFTTAPPPSPGLVRTLIVREQKPAHAPPPEAKPVPRAAPVVNAGPGGTRPMAIPASTVAVSPAAGAASPAASGAPAQPSIQPTAIMSTAAFAPTAVRPAAPMRPVALEPPAPGDAPPPPPAMGEKPSNHESSPTTMFDGGALRDHAYRIASMPPDQAHAAAQEYAALVKQRAGRDPSDPPAVAMSFSAQETGAKKAPDDVATTPPEAPRATTTVASGAKVILLKERLVKSWKETSNVKKAILFLLPFAAAATLLERDPEPDEAPAPAKHTQVASATKAKRATEGTATPGSSAPAAPASATSAARAAGATATAPTAPVASATPTAPVASATPTTPVASAAPTVAVAESAASVASAEPVARAAAASAAPSTAVVATTAAVPASSAARTSKIAANDPSADKRKPQSDEDDPDQRALTLEHMALAATFGGNLSQAAMMYEKLAHVKPDAQVFALAARLVKVGAVRSP